MVLVECVIFLHLRLRLEIFFSYFLHKYPVPLYVLLTTVLFICLCLVSLPSNLQKYIKNINGIGKMLTRHKKNIFAGGPQQSHSEVFCKRHKK